MAIGSSDRYRVMVEDSYRFAQDEVILNVVKQTRDGYVPVYVRFTEGEIIPQNTVTDAEIGAPVPRELAELILAAFGRYFLSTEGDLVVTNQRLTRELHRVTQQLESLIAGIGRLGSSKD